MPARHGLSVQYREISTDGMKPADRFAFWRGTCLQLVEPTDAPDGVYDRFRARSQRLTGSIGSFADNWVTPMHVRRTQLLCARDGIDDIAISLEVGGGGIGRVGAAEKTVVFAPGDLHVLDFRQPLLANWNHGTHRGLFVTLPRAGVLTALGRRSRDLMHAVLPGDGLAPLLATQMRTLAELLPGLNETARALALRVTIDLAVTVLCLDLGAAKAESDECTDGLFAAALLLINSNFASGNLSPEMIARRLGCSRAHLYRLFERHGMTVAGQVREVRLQRCRAALEAEAVTPDTIGDIAFRCGFANPAHFTRLFTQRFGVRPSEARTAAAARLAAAPQLPATADIRSTFPARD